MCKNILHTEIHRQINMITPHISINIEYMELELDSLLLNILSVETDK